MDSITGVWFAIAVIAALVVGGGFGAVLFGEDVEVPGETEVVVQCSDGTFTDDSIFCPDLVISNDTSTETEVEVEVEVEMSAEDQWLNPAIDDVYSELDDDDDFLTCDKFEYDEDEIEITKIREWGYTWYDDDEYAVWFTGKFKFDEEDERSCRETRTYEVFYEEGEDPEVELIPASE